MPDAYFEVFRAEKRATIVRYKNENRLATGDSDPAAEQSELCQ